MSAEELSERLLNRTLRLYRNDMNLLDSNGSLKKYHSTEESKLEWQDLALRSKLKKELDLLENKMKFIDEVVNGTLALNNKWKEDLCAELKDRVEYMAHAMSAEELSERLLNRTLRLYRNDMNLLDSNGSLKKYHSPEESKLEWQDLALRSKLKKELDLLENKMKFIDEVANGTLALNNKWKEDLCAELKDRGYESGKLSQIIILSHGFQDLATFGTCFPL
ncbi:hypothetical protein L6452_30383 [Arctium lappa]|uniref:Uncharacterized protein n=1 Tax=Arctium lappa TaxID=4217 RepID=A0ACB8ZIR1_ARCLA|nr:hypothetical protein L6452_30383 [Arctium lappa]